jgi:hypothetical protein
VTKRSGAPVAAWRSVPISEAVSLMTLDA